MSKTASNSNKHAEAKNRLQEPRKVPKLARVVSPQKRDNEHLARCRVVVADDIQHVAYRLAFLGSPAHTLPTR